MATPRKVIDRDRGWKELRRQLSRTSASRRVHVGIQGDEAAEARGGEVTNVLIAATHEFGTIDGRIPQRSFIRATIDEQANSYRALAKQLGRAVVERKLTTTQALEQFGMRVVADIRKRIRGRIDPALQQSTIDRKGSSVPLIDTGQLVQAITHKVTEAG